MGDDAGSGEDAEESDDDSDDEEEDDEEMGDVDPAFRARVAEALQVSGMGVETNGDGESDDDDESSDEEVWDDEQMLKVDEQLAAVFRDRAAASGGKKVDKSEHFIHSRQVIDANV
jgi:DNA polymerase phi